MNLAGAVIHYGGDAEAPLVAWFRRRLKSIATAYSDSAEACLVMLYSGLDTFGWLASDEVEWATRDSFIQWCDLYLFKHLKADPAITGRTLYKARCGVLHTSNSAFEIRGNEVPEPQIFYSYKGLLHMNFNPNSPCPPVTLSVEDLMIAFKSGGKSFLDESAASQTVHAKAHNFFRAAHV